ncbi:MAG: phosphatase PAP2 family protein [Oscillospiraceae bacterium]|nr:phosphatase PAP2 family protein [Oscillospiraceae bacterium]
MDHMNVKRTAGIMLMLAFVMWTILIQCVDVRTIGPEGSAVGFASLNGWFHELTGVNWMLYSVTDWMGLVPVCCCMIFGMIGFVQLIRRRSLKRVDADLTALGVYYLAIILGYLLFEMIPLNFRPVLIEGRLEASYPSSTTLLVLSVMPTVIFHVKRRVKHSGIRNGLTALSAVFALCMVIGRLLSGVHWVTDIIGAVLLSTGMYLLYQSVVMGMERKKTS